MEIKVAQNAIFSKIRKFDDSQINLMDIFFLIMENFEKSAVIFFAQQIQIYKVTIGQSEKFPISWPFMIQLLLRYSPHGVLPPASCRLVPTRGYEWGALRYDRRDRTIRPRTIWPLKVSIGKVFNFFWANSPASKIRVMGTVWKNKYS